MKYLKNNFKPVLVLGIAFLLTVFFLITKPFSNSTNEEVENQFFDGNFNVKSVIFDENGYGSIVFSLVPKTNLENANLEFTFAQGMLVNGDLNSWENRGETKQKLMDLEAFAIYEWTVELEPESPNLVHYNSKIWTDFTVNGESKKIEIQNIMNAAH
jgi:hypothetical protein